MKHHIEVTGKCTACDGLGLYQGIAERPPYAVVCSRCKGKGERIYTLDYEDFEGRPPIPKDIQIVVDQNPGIVLGGNSHDFGGLPVDEWLAGESFKGRENRLYTCPKWWSGQRWNGNGCNERMHAGQSFSACPKFHDKAECWAIYDKEGAIHAEPTR